MRATEHTTPFNLPEGQSTIHSGISIRFSTRAHLCLTETMPIQPEESAFLGTYASMNVVFDFVRYYEQQLSNADESIFCDLARDVSHPQRGGEGGADVHGGFCFGSAGPPALLNGNVDKQNTAGWGIELPTVIVVTGRNVLLIFENFEL